LPSYEGNSEGRLSVVIKTGQFLGFDKRSDCLARNFGRRRRGYSEESDHLIHQMDFVDFQHRKEPPSSHPSTSDSHRFQQPPLYPVVRGLMVDASRFA